MAVQVKVPPMGESVVEATIARWHKKKGDPVAAGDLLVELETDKVNQEVSADRAGILGEILAGEGSSVAPGDLLAVIEEKAPDAATAPAPAAGAPPVQQDEAPRRKPASGDPPAADESPASDGKATPLAIRVAAELQVDISHVVGSGPGGRINREDVEEYARTAGLKEPAPTPPNTVDHEAPPAPATAPPGPPARTAPPGSAPPTSQSQPAPEPAQTAAPDRPEVRQRLSRRRLTIAHRLVEAQRTAAMLTTFNEVDLTAVMELRKRRKEWFKEQHGVGLGFMSFFCKAAVGALKAFPEINSELQGEELVIKHYYDLGIAVGAKEGLVVPVVRGVDRLSFAQIEQQISDLATRAREGGLSLDDLRGGTFTITNGGVFGSMLSTPILNPPQVAILGMHRIQERPVALNGEVAIRPMMYLALTYDHRVVDGSGAVQFLVRLRDLLQDPERLLLEG